MKIVSIFCLAFCLLAAVLACATTTERKPAFTRSGNGDPRIVENLEKHVRALAEEIGERNIWRPGTLDRAAAYIESSFSEIGLAPSRQEYSVNGTVVCNIEAEITGSSAADEIFVVGAHYDSAPGTPGANDNAGGVASMLEMARLLSGSKMKKTVRFVAFVNEEPPFFQTDKMGSFVYAKRCKERKERIAGMFSLETMGYYSNEEGSQRYPFPFNLFHPSTGNFIGLVGNLASKSLIAETHDIFQRVSDFPIESSSAPEFISAIGLSDQWSFWQMGYPAMMVTDTAMFRYPYYHTPDDTPEKIDYSSLARVVAGLADAVAALSGSELPLPPSAMSQHKQQ